MKNFSDEEYSRIWQEESQRLNLAYSMGEKITGITYTYWGLIFAAVGVIISNNDTIDNKDFLFIIAMIATFLFGLPIFIILANSYKYYENLCGIGTNAKYVLFFYEFKSYLEKTDLRLWESIHYNKVEDKVLNKLSADHLILSIFSIILSIISFGLCIFVWASNNVNMVIGIIFSVLYAAYLVILFISSRKIMSNTNTAKVFGKDFEDAQFEHYIKMSEKLEIYSEEELEKFKAFKNKIRGITNN